MHWTRGAASGLETSPSVWEASAKLACLLCTIVWANERTPMLSMSVVQPEDECKVGAGRQTGLVEVWVRAELGPGDVC